MGLKRDRVKDGLNQRFGLAVVKVYRAYCSLKFLCSFKGALVQNVC